MIFRVLNLRRFPSPTSEPGVYLTLDNWNDFSYYTLFYLTYIDEEGGKHDM